MPRRKHGTGTIKVKNGTFFIGFRPAPGAKQVWEKVGRIGEGVTRKQAEELLEQRRVEARKGQIPRNRFTLEEVASDWREERAFANLAPKTREGENTALDVHLLPAFGKDYLDQITPDLLRQYIARKLRYAPGHRDALPVAGKRAKERPKPLGTTAVRQQLQTLNKIYEWAIDRGKAVANPCSRVDKRELRQTAKELDVFEIEEVKALLQAAESEEDKTIFLLLAGCGLRIGELLALKNQDYDPSARTLHVQRTIRREGGRTTLGNGPKTSAGDRFLVLEPVLSQALEAQIERVRREGRNSEGLVFPNKRGKVRSAENFRQRHWKPALQRARIPLNRGPHALRHTFASELIQARKSDTDIASKMGHKNAQITRMIYAKSFERTRATEAGVVDLYLNEDQPEPTNEGKAPAEQLSKTPILPSKVRGLARKSEDQPTSQGLA